MDRETAPRFRVILITSDHDPRPLVERAGLLAPRTVGVMLRNVDSWSGSGGDMQRRGESVERMISTLLTAGIPENVVPIVNLADPEVDVPEGWWSHLPARLVGSGPEAGETSGCSAHSAEELVAGNDWGARYMTISPIHPTPSKPGNPGLGIRGLKELNQIVRRPLFALGGIDTPERVSEVIRAGAYGFAALRAGTMEGGARLTSMLAALDREIDSGERDKGEAS